MTLITEPLPLSLKGYLWTGRIGSQYVSTKFPLFVCRHWLLIFNLSSSFTLEATKVSEPADIVMGCDGCFRWTCFHAEYNRFNHVSKTRL